MHILKRLYRLPLVRNLSGAVAGTVVALVLYGVYGIGTHVVAALVPSTEPNREELRAQEARDAKLIETARRAKEIMDRVE